MTGDLSVYDLYRDMENLRKRINILENKIFPDPELQKKFKDCKFKASEFVRLTVSQYRKLYKEFGKRMVRRFICSVKI
jgi:vacuolar-type H+-ATPase subunit D/Vma8